MVPAAMNLVRSCGSRAVSWSLALVLANWTRVCGCPTTKGVMLVGEITGVPAMVAVGTGHCALMVVPCGMEPIRHSVLPTRVSWRYARDGVGSGFGQPYSGADGLLVAGTCIHRPFSK